MAVVKLAIGGRIYQMACEDGQEAHLYRLGEYLDEKAKLVRQSSQQINEPLMLTMAGVMTADELFSARAGEREISAVSGEATLDEAASAMRRLADAMNSADENCLA
ncbi:cell division protein ZapA [Alphaproteobacteria bacterium]|nr:cell division protein ZapA [Alphaproteobacteria bacterium]